MFPIVRTTLPLFAPRARALILASPKKRTTTISKDGGKKASVHSVDRAGAEEADRRAAQDDFKVRAFVRRRFKSGLVEAIGNACVERRRQRRRLEKDDKDDEDDDEDEQEKRSISREGEGGGG